MTFDNDEAPYKSTRPGTWSFQRANWILTRLILCQILILKKGQKVEKIKIIKVEKIKIIRRTFHYLWILKFTIQPLWKLRPDMKLWKPWMGISTGVSFSSETDIVILGFFSGGEGPSGRFISLALFSGVEETNTAYNFQKKPNTCHFWSIAVHKEHNNTGLRENKQRK